MNKTMGVTKHNVEDVSNEIYWDFLDSMKYHFDELIFKHNHIFTTDAANLFDIYIEYLPEEFRQRYVCNACRHFVERYGNLAFINADGTLEPALWSETVHPFFEDAFEAIRNTIKKSKVTGVFLTDKAVLGQSVTGKYRHMSIVVPFAKVLSKNNLCTPFEMMAEKKEDFRILNSAIEKYPMDVVAQAVTILKSEVLYRSERCLGVGKWFFNLHTELNKTKDIRKQANMIWLAVAGAPAGFCHVNSSMIGTLLDDIAEGLDIQTVRRKFASKMDPTIYQRKQTPPSAGNIKRAEEIFEKKGLAKSLERRFARLDEIQTIWKPVEEKLEETTGGLFGHLLPKEEKVTSKVDLPEVKMTWEKFQRTVLPEAEKIEFKVSNFRLSDSYTALVTAEHQDAPPIIQWDNEENRNPFSHYVYGGNVPCNIWNLSPGWNTVTAVTLQPSMWQEGFDHQGKAVIFIIEDCKDTNYRDGGKMNALFPEIVKSELREVSATLMAYANEAPIGGYDESSACGLRLQHGVEWDAMFRVTTSTGTALYKLDRWD